MSADYAHYVALEGLLFAIQELYPSEVQGFETKVADDMAELWYTLDPLEREERNAIQKLRLLRREKT